MKEQTIPEIKETLRDIIAGELDANIDRKDLDDEVSLYDDGLGLDSIAIINLIVLIEKRFDICFEEGEISAKLFCNINSLADFIHERTARAEINR